MNELSGKIAVVTGGGRGIGRRAAIRLAALGAHVVLVARSEPQLRETAATIEASGGAAAVVPLDLGRQTSHETIQRLVHDLAGSPSILVNAAGIFGPIALVQDTDPAAW